MYNGARYLRQALDALLGQGLREFHVVALDDGSTDESYSILEEYARKDARITLYRNPERTGLIAAWNRVAELAGEICNPEYFAWYADHDWVSENWLEILVTELEGNASITLAHPITVVVNEDGVEGGVEEKSFDTRSLDELQIARETALGYVGAGDLIYGLFRYQLLKKLNYLPVEIMPDRLLISEICFDGNVAYVNFATRFRRNLSPDNYSEVLVQRQLNTLFEPRDSDCGNFPYLSHATYFIRKFFGHHNLDENQASLRLIHALLYFQRQRNKFEDEWKKELSSLKNGKNALQGFIPLIELVLDEGWAPIEYDTLSRLKNVKGLNRELTEELKHINTLYAQEQLKLNQLGDKYGDLEGKLERARLELSIADIKRRETRSQSQATQQELLEVRKELVENQTRRKEVKDQLQAARQDLEEVRKELAETQAIRKDVEAQLHSTQQELEEVRKELAENKTRRKAVKDQLLATQQELKKIRKELVNTQAKNAEVSHKLVVAQEELIMVGEAVVNEQMQKKVVEDQLQQSQSQLIKVEQELSVSNEKCEGGERQLLETLKRLEVVERDLIIAREKYQEVIKLFVEANQHPIKFASLLTYHSSKNYIKKIFIKGRQ